MKPKSSPTSTDLPSHRDPDLRLLWGETERPRSRTRTDKSATLTKIAEIARRKTMQNTPKRQSFEASQEALDRVVTYAAEDYLTFSLQSIASELLDHARELRETRTVEPILLKNLTRRLMACYLVASDIQSGETSTEKALETLRNPHRMRGVELP